MRDVTVRVSGGAELRRALKRAGVELSDLKDSNRKVAGLVAGIAQTRAPRRLGRLAASVRGNRAVSRATVSAGSVALPYAAPIHWGWPSRNIEPQPFIAAAAQETEPVWLPIYEQEVRQIAGRV